MLNNESPALLIGKLIKGRKFYLHLIHISSIASFWKTPTWAEKLNREFSARNYSPIANKKLMKCTSSPSYCQFACYRMAAGF